MYLLFIHLFVYLTALSVTLNKSRRMRWVGYVAHMAEEEHRVLVGKPEEKRPLGIPRHTWEDTKTDLREIGRGGMD
jgi:hypothetical protein